MSDQFLNVYNFIPLSKHKAKKYVDEDKHTGYIEYQIVTKTPLFIPNTTDDSYLVKGCSDHKSYDFYSYTDLSMDFSKQYHEPVIPGSQMRGLVRSLYETLTSSCMSVINNDFELSKRVGKPYDPGLLCRDGDRYILCKAQSYSIKRNGDFSEGQSVRFNPRKTSADVQRNGSKIGYIFEGEMKRNSPKRNRYHVYEFKSETNLTFNEEEIIDLLGRTIQSYQAQKDGSGYYQRYKEALYDFLDGNSSEMYFPVNYRVDGKLCYLSCARITREVSNYQVKDMVGEFNPCEDGENLCPTCDLFGVVNQKNGLATTSKLRFSDLSVLNKEENNKDYYLKDLTLPILGGPKSSNTAFYFKKPSNDAAYWTFDYYVSNRGSIVQMAEIQGRKYYWHFKSNLQEGLIPDRMNKTVRPLKAGVSFVGKVYFDDISHKQLEQLKLILSGFDGDCSYKLGTGKPLGMGSIDCKLVSIKERINFKDGYPCFEEDDSSVETKPYEDVGFDLDVEAPFKLICDFSACEGLEVSYPKKSANDKGYEWFNVNLGRNGRFANPLKPLNKNVNDASSLMLPKSGLNDNAGGRRGNDRNRSNYRKKSFR